MQYTEVVTRENVVNDAKDAQQTQGIQGTQRATNNIVVLDGVRAFAIISVVAFHIEVLVNNALWSEAKYPWLSAIATFGGSGVTLFFVLSGFLLFMPFAKALLFQGKWPSIRQFYIKRAARIIPAYYVALLLIVLFFQTQYLRPDHWGQLAIFLLFFMDSTRDTFRQLNGPFWTLAIEWQFYMLLPLIALVFLCVARRLTRATPARRLLFMLGCCAALITWGLAVRYVGVYYMRHPIPDILKIPQIFLFGMTGKYLENFAVGMVVCLCYIYAQHPEHGQVLKKQVRRLSPLLGVLGLALLYFTAAWHFHVIELHTQTFAILDPLLPYFDWLNEMVIAIGYGTCIAALLFGYAWLKRPFEWRPLCWVGLISYGMYMWHLPLLDFFNTRVLPVLKLPNLYLTWVALWIWVALVVVLVAFLSYQCIEKPWIKWSASFRAGRRLKADSQRQSAV